VRLFHGLDLKILSSQTDPRTQNLVTAMLLQLNYSQDNIEISLRSKSMRMFKILPTLTSRDSHGQELRILSFQTDPRTQSQATVTLHQMRLHSLNIISTITIIRKICPINKLTRKYGDLLTQTLRLLTGQEARMLSFQMEAKTQSLDMDTLPQQNYINIKQDIMDSEYNTGNQRICHITIIFKL